MEKAMKARKEYKCINCHKIIKIGEIYIFGKSRVPKYKDNDVFYNDQIGISYIQYRLCLRERCGEREWT